MDELEREKEESMRPLTSGVMDTGMDGMGYLMFYTLYSVQYTVDCILYSVQS